MDGRGRAIRADGIRIDGDVLQLYPSPAGPQHDECKTGRFGHFWEKGRRDVPEDAVLHPSVKERFEQPPCFTTTR